MNTADISFIKILALMLTCLFALMVWACCVVAGDADDRAEEMAQRRREASEDDKENSSCRTDADL